MSFIRRACVLLTLVPSLAPASETCERNCAEVSVDATRRQIIVRGPDGSDLYVDSLPNEPGGEHGSGADRKMHVIPIDDLAALQQPEHARLAVATDPAPEGGTITTVSIFDGAGLISRTVITVSSGGIVQVKNG